MKQISMLDLKREYMHLKNEIDSALKKCLEHQRWILGPEVKELEDRISHYIGVNHCVGVSSGTDALVLSLRALAIKLKKAEYFEKEDEIICPSFTFTATGDAILRAGATPVFVDVDPQTFCIDPRKIRDYLESQRRKNVVGIVPVHLYGRPCEMDEIIKIAKEYGLFVVEDVAQAFGGMWKGKKLGSFGDAGCFSFFPSKNLGGYGDGGMVSTNDDEIAEIVRMLLKHGGKDKYNVDHIGYNSRLDTLQAAVLLAKFKYVDEFNIRRREIAKKYAMKLGNLDTLSTPDIGDSHRCYHVFNQFTIRVKNGKRDELKAELKNKGIETMVYYPVPLHKMKVFDGRCKTFGDLEESEMASKEVLSLPIDPLMDEGEIERVIFAVEDFFKKAHG